MKKIAIVIVLVVLAGLLTAPKFIGDRAHREYLKSFTEYPSDSAGISIEQKSYEQSWFSSRAVTEIRIPLNKPGIKDISMVVTSKVSHGPILFTGKGIAFGLAYVNYDITLADLPPSAQKLADQYLPAGTIAGTSLIGFDQVSTDAMHVRRISFKDDKTSAEFGGMEYSGVSKLDYSMLKGNIVLPASHFASENITVDIADASLKYDQHKSLGMLLGKTDMNIPKISFVARQGAVTLEDMQFASNSDEQSGKVNMAGSFGVRKITAPVPITAFQYEIDLNQIDDKAITLWSDISKDMKDMQPRPADPAAILNNPKMRQLVELLLQKGIEMKQQFTLDGVNGRLNIDWGIHSIGLPEGVHIDGSADRDKILKAIDSLMTVSIDQKMLMASPLAKMVYPYMQHGMIVKQGDKLVSKFKLTNGVLTVNGIPLPLKKAGG